MHSSVVMQEFYALVSSGLVDEGTLPLAMGIDQARSRYQIGTEGLATALEHYFEYPSGSAPPFPVSHPLGPSPPEVLRRSGLRSRLLGSKSANAWPTSGVPSGKAQAQSVKSEMT